MQYLAPNPNAAYSMKKREACRHTRCVTMQEAVPVTRPLQNHLPEVTHFTTDAGEWMPQ